ncbi:hypothetical protein M405DRAFT_100215 [Rhizopogon salebrosus TDB-379]|nr:hypothetical protein M405DRAFT_100215 [Rhizopogon salebrosus TDB-379]
MAIISLAASSSCTTLFSESHITGRTPYVGSPTPAFRPSGEGRIIIPTLGRRKNNHSLFLPSLLMYIGRMWIYKAKA